MVQHMNFQTITRPHDFINVSSDFILKIIREKKTRVNIALSGGSTPQKTYESLAKKLSFMPFKNQLHFYQVDERYVAATNKDSNQKMISEAFAILTDNTHNPLIHFHFFDTSLPIKDSLKKYSKELPKTPFDLIVLGIGPDGHTASLFPAAKNATNYKALTTKSTLAHTTTTNFPVKDRLTITFSTILKSKNLLILLKEKPEILTELKTPTKSTQEFPAHKLTKHKKLSILSN